MLITHDLGVVSEMADRVIVMYAGRRVEEASVYSLFDEPLHPYTIGLMGCDPAIRGGHGGAGERLVDIPGTVPPLWDLPQGCAFAPRCPNAAGAVPCRAAAVRGEAARALRRMLGGASAGADAPARS